MKSPPKLLEQYLDRTLEIPNERPDLLQADAKKRYFKAGIAGTCAVANYFASTKNYIPSIQPEADIANTVGFIGGFAGTLIYGFSGVFQRFRADELSFMALERQLEHQENNGQSQVEE
jgi:hypothetical protein